MAQYLIDTNIISHYFSETISEKGLLFMDSIIDAIPNLSVITQIELLSWKTNSSVEKLIQNFISDSNILDITPAIIEHCVSLRRNRKIKTPDAIIAATAIAFGYVLLTDNEKDFANIKSLKTINPHHL